MKKSKAFSLVELAVVGLIISVLIAGILGSSALKKRSIITNARTQTNNSPVTTIGDLVAWYETTSEKSFSTDEAADGSTISTWYDLNPNVETVRNNATQTTAGNRPAYKTNKINGLPAVSFTRANSNFLAFDGTSLANSNYTIFVVEQRTSNDSSNTFIGGTSATTNSNLSFAYQDGTITIDQQNNGLTRSVFLSYSTPTPRIHTFSFNFSTKKYYANGMELALNGTGASYNIAQGLAAFPGAALGANRISGLEKYFQGDIGEVIIFKKYLNTEERRSVEKYLGKKWSITVSYNSSACNGIITNNGCETSCPVSIVGVSSPSSVAGGTSGTFTCTTPQYNDTIPYTCSNVGVLDISGQSCDVCNSGGGYSFYNGTCQGQCTIGSITGVLSASPVNPGAATVACNDTANNYSGSVTGICNAGVFTLNGGQTCQCKSGYEFNGSACVVGCTGGTISSFVDGGGVTRKVHIFSTVGSATFQCPNSKNIDILVVGGGGGGSRYYDGGGGGGGGGVVYKTSFSTSAATSYAITVGGGGAYNSSCYGSNGGDSKFDTIITAKGGGGGGGHFYSGYCAGTGATGGSGGGGGRDSGASSGGATSANTYPVGAVSYGNIGGSSSSSWGGGGGGGGASSVGGNGSGGSAAAEKSGDGGNGVQINISGVTPVPYYGAGGGGGVNGSAYASKGGSYGNTGAGGNGGSRAYSGGTPVAATNGANGYGSGGGGSHPNAPGNPGNGGSGVVIISY